MSATYCYYCLKPLPCYEGYACLGCASYMKSLWLSPRDSDRERGDYLIDTAIRHATNRFNGRSD